MGFWVQYKYEEGYGGQLSLGLNGAPFSPDFAILRWTDTSTTALRYKIIENKKIVIGSTFSIVSTYIYL